MRPRLLTSRGFRWLVAVPFAAGLLIYGLNHNGEPSPAPTYSPWSLIP